MQPAERFRADLISDSSAKRNRSKKRTAAMQIEINVAKTIISNLPGRASLELCLVSLQFDWISSGLNHE